MLILSRKKSEQIFVIDRETGERIVTVMCVDIRGDKCRFGFDAPERYIIHRKEVFEAIQRENAKVNCRPPVIPGC